jgi:amino acid adenylation domain-containing protein
VRPSPAHPDAWAEASSAQGGLWFLENVDPESTAHVLVRTYRVTGPLDVTALRASWFAVLDRHPVLRTRFTECDGRVCARVEHADEAAFALGAAARPPRLADGPAATLAVVPVAADEHDVILSAHRAVADDESMSILAAELSGRVRPPVGGLPAVPRAGDPAEWRRSTIDPVPAPVALPVDRARPARPSAAGGAIRFEWPFPAAPDTVLAAFAVLLGRYGGQDRIAIGVPCDLPTPDDADVVGPYQNIAVVCVDLSGRPSFATVVDQVGRSLAAAYRAPSFDALVRALDVDRDPRRIPLCDIMFRPPVADAPLSLPGLSVTRRHVEPASVAADLTLALDADSPSVRGSLAYRSCLFDSSSVTRLLGQLRTLLDAALASPGLPIGDLPLEDRRRLRASVRAADGIAAALQDARPAHELFRACARRWPDAAAIRWQDRIVTYAELAAHAAAIRAVLPDAAGRPVVVRMATGPTQVAAVLGVLAAGAYVVCLGDGDAGERGRTVLADLRPSHVLVDRQAGADPLARWYADEFAGRVVDVSTGGPAGRPIVVPASLSDRAYVTYTSGSTGTPKGIPHNHGTLGQFTTWFAQRFDIGPGTRLAQWAAPGYDASLCESLVALVAGATLCPVPERVRSHPGLVVDWLAEQHVTVFQTVPGFARQILRVLTRRGSAHRLRSLSQLLLAGEQLPGDLANGLRAALPHVRLVNLYGPTESILATCHEITGDVHGTVPIGGPIPGRQVLVLDADGKPCPTGVTGEIVLRGPYVTAGYVGDAVDTAAFAPLRARPEFGIPGGPCYRTGDLGRLRWDGTLEFRGRKDFQVKFNGIRVELGGIEAALAEQASVAECAVVAIPRAAGLAARLVAYVVPRRGARGEALGGIREWQAALRGRFGRSMPPVALRTMIGLPRGIGGKVDRSRLPSPWATVRTARRPATPVARRVAAVWVELLGSARVDNFFAAGGHSLLALVLLARIREWFGISVPLVDFLADPTLTGTCALVESTLAAPVAGPRSV